MELEFASKIEAVLFWKAEPVTVDYLVKSLVVSEQQITEGLKALETSLVGRGICLVWKDNEVELRTPGAAAPIIEALNRELTSEELSKAALETLTIILYRGPISRTEIDYIRGVNSTYTLRSLLVRGLAEKIPKADDARTFLYRSTFDLLGHLGLTKITELPDYELLATV